MTAIRTITDPQELTRAMRNDVRAGNERTCNEINRLRGLLKGGLKEEERLTIRTSQTGDDKERDLYYLIPQTGKGRENEDRN